MDRSEGQPRVWVNQHYCQISTKKYWYINVAKEVDMEVAACQFFGQESDANREKKR